MNVEIIRASQNKTSIWSGGKTSEIYISPKNSDFKKLNFDFRLSIATVEVDESIFTSLPNVNRTLLVLEGNLHLLHEAQHECHLQPFEQNSFKGDWTTKSIGKVTDFNLMCMGETKGTLNYFSILENQTTTKKLIARKELFYLYKGEISIQNQTLKQGDLIIFENAFEQINFTTSNQKVSLIHISIN